MKTIKYFSVVTALATTLGPVVNVQAGPGQSRLAGDLLEMQREGREKAAQLQKEEREKAARLQAAACSGSLNDAIKALGAGANINAVNYRGETSLLLATQNHHPEIVAMLLKAKAEVNKADSYRLSPLCLASVRGQAKIAGMLLEAKAEVNMATAWGESPLFEASSQGHTEIAKMLLEANAEVDKDDEHGQTSLFLASKKGHAEIVEMLLEAKAEVNKADMYGFAPLLEASSKGHTEIAIMLLQAKAEVNKAWCLGWISSLSLASKKGHIELAKRLVFSGAIPSGREPREMKAVIEQAQEARKEALQAVAEQEQLNHDLKTLPSFSVAAIHALCCDYAAPYCQDPFFQQEIDLVRIQRDQKSDDICVVQ